MKYNKLLQKQIEKFLSDDLLKDKAVSEFINSVNDSFNYYERDKALSERAFKISEEEYQQVNEQLKAEFERKNKSIRNLRESLGLVGTDQIESEDLIAITELLNERLEERNAALKGITESEERNRLIMNGALDAVLIINQEGRITFWNAQAERIFGWSESEIINSVMSDYLVPEQYRKAHADGMRRYLSTKEGKVIQTQLELTALRKSGEEFPIELYIIPIEQKGKLQFCAFIRDISLRKKTEEELKQTSQVASLNKNGVILTDYKGRITWSNKQFLSLTGYSIDEVLGNTSIQLLRGPKSSQEKINELLHSYVQCRDFEIEVIGYKKGGGEFWIKCIGQLVPGETFNQNKYFVIIEDITQQKLVQEQFRLQEEKYRNIIANMNLGLLEVDVNDKVEFANQSFLDMSGYTLDDLLGEEAKTKFVDPHYFSLIEYKNRVRELGESDAYELKVRTKSGATKWWLISGAPKLDDKGDLIGSIGIHLDITEQKRTQSELQSSLRKLEVANNGLREFAHVVSHDLKSPLRSISGLVQILQEDYNEKFDEEGKQIVEDVITRTEHMNELIGGILSYSSVQHTQDEYEYFDSEDIINRILNFIEIPENVKVRVKGNYPRLRMNQTHFQQLIQNLITNAIKYNDKEIAEIKIIFEEDDLNNIILVKDNGRGINKRNESKIFDMFQKFDTKGKSSSGIGLAIVKKIIELYNGSLSLQTEVGIGSTFCLTLPKTTTNEYT